MDWTYVLASLAGIFGGAKSLSSTIKEGEKGVKTTFGKAARTKDGKVKVLGSQKIPILLPFVQKFVKTHIKSNTQHLPGMGITLKNGLSYTFDASLEYDVLDDPDHMENVLFTLEDHLEFITLNFKIAIQTILYKYDETPEKMKMVGADIKKELTTLLGDNGFKVKTCGILNLTETPTSQGSRSVDYRIQAAQDHLGVDRLPECVLMAALGSTPVVGMNDCKNDNNQYEYTEE